MRTHSLGAASRTAPAHSPSPNVTADPRVPSTMFIVSIAAGLVTVASCADAPTMPTRDAGRGAPVMLNATAAAAVRTVLADIAFRLYDAIEDSDTRSSFAATLRPLTWNVEVGNLDDAMERVGQLWRGYT